VALLPPRGAAALYDRLLRECARALRPGGHAVVEVGRGQEGFVLESGRRADLRPVRTITDLQGLPRTLVFERL
jgi:methylase of polypeptide subunit release factors